MIVVSDTSPLNYLILIGHIDVLPSLYQWVLIPPAVRDEMLHHSAPAAVRDWATSLPRWLRVQKPFDIPRHLPLDLGSGEHAAICLALDTNPLFVILDEALGRQAADSVGLPVIGTLGVLKEASRRNLIDLDAALARLQATNFHVSSALLRRVLQDRPKRCEQGI